MSFATSTDRRRLPWLVVVPLALAAAAASYIFGVIRARPSAGTVAIIVAAAAFGAVALQIWKMLLAAVSRVEAPEAVAKASDRRRRELEREKGMLLKAIKELEFDRAMGKLSDADYRDASATYRARAVRIIGELDASRSSYREIIEREVAERLSIRSGRPAPATADDAARPAPVCECGTTNDVDAVFCKKCGSRLSPAIVKEARS